MFSMRPWIDGEFEVASDAPTIAAMAATATVSRPSSSRKAPSALLHGELLSLRG